MILRSLSFFIIDVYCIKILSLAYLLIKIFVVQTLENERINNMVLLFSIVFLIITIFFYTIEKTKECKITPIFALGIPYGIIMLLVAIRDTFWNYGYSINVRIPIFSCIYIIIFAVVGRLAKIIFNISNKKKFSNIKQNSYVYKFRHEKLYFFGMLLFLVFILVYYIVTLGFRLHGHLEVKAAFANGLPAHMVNFITALMIVNFVSLLNRRFIIKKKLLYLLPILWAAFLLVADTKYTLFMYIFALIFEFTYIKKIKITKVAILSLCASGLFIVVYAIRFLLEGYNIYNIPFNFIFRHFIYYLIGSFYGYSKIIDISLMGSAGFGIIFAPIINLFKLISNENLISTVAQFVPVYIGNSYQATNVFTLFGALQYETSAAGTIVLLMLISFFIYYYFYKMQKFKDLKYIPLVSYLCSTLVVSFFNCFYGTVTVWEVTIILLIITYIERIKIMV